MVLGKNPQQNELPFALAEASFNERKNQLGLALLKIGCDAELSIFIQWVFNVTHGGTSGELLKSYRDLSLAPWGLCCSTAKARSTVGLAKHAGLITIAENRYTSGGQKANAYQIDWIGVSHIIRPRPASHIQSHSHINQSHESSLHYERSGASTEHPPALPEHPHASTEHPPALPEHPHKEITSSSCVCLSDDVVDKSFLSTKAARVKFLRRCQEVTNELFPHRQNPLDEETRELIMQVVLLSQTIFEDKWLDKAIRATKRFSSTNPPGYLKNTLANICSEYYDKCPSERAFEYFNALLRQARPIVNALGNPIRS